MKTNCNVVTKYQMSWTHHLWEWTDDRLRLLLFIVRYDFKKSDMIASHHRKLLKNLNSSMQNISAITFSFSLSEKVMWWWKSHMTFLLSYDVFRLYFCPTVSGTSNNIGKIHLGKTVIWFFPTVPGTSDNVEKSYMTVKKSYDFFTVIWLLRQCLLKTHKWNFLTFGYLYI